MNTWRRRTLVPASLLLLLLMLLSTAPGYGQWRKLNSTEFPFPGVFFNEVFFIDNNTGWLARHAGIVTRTTDGGNTWLTSTLPGATSSFNRDLCFLSTTHGFVSGDDGIWKTTDGGATWTNITPNPQVHGNASHWFIDANNGVYGYGGCNMDTVRFFRTSDGGVTWDSVKYAHTMDVAVGGICYSGGAYHAAGGVGKYWKSTDNGANWTYSSTGSNGFHEDAVAMAGVIHLASVDGSVCGISGSSKMLRSTDNGTSWRMVNFPGVVMWGVSMYSPTDGWCCADNAHAYQTTDGGATWTERSCGLDRLDRIDDIHFTDATHGWAVGDGVYKFGANGWTKRPDTIDFGDVIVGEMSRDTNAILKAIGSTIQISQRNITGADPTHFFGPLGLGAQNVLGCTDGPTALRFRPLSEGVKTARLEYSLIGFPETPVVYLRGRGVKPRINADREFLFDTLRCEDRKIDTIMVRNNGTAPLRVTGITSTAPPSVAFQVMQPTLPFVIPPGDSARVFVLVITNTSGPISGTLSITSNDLDPDKAPLVIPIKGYRRQISLDLLPDTLITLPPMPFGERSTVCLTYVNTGDGLQVLDSTVAQTGDAIIRQEPSSFAVAVLRDGKVYICFSATASDTNWHVRRFRIRTQPCGLDTFVTVRYRASFPLIGSKDSLTLVSGACDSTATDTIRIVNTGTGPLVVQKPTFGGKDSTLFHLLSPTSWPDTIPVGGERLVVVQSRVPVNASGTKQAVVTFQNNDGLPGKNPWKVQLFAQRGTSDLSLNGRQIDLGEICTNDTARALRVVLRNTGTAAAIVRTVSTENTAVPLVVEKTATVIPAGGMDSVVFRIASSPVPGPFSAMYIVRYDPCDRQDTVMIQGNVIGVGLAAVPPQLNYGSTRVSRAATRSFNLKNTGTAGITIRSWNFDPPLPGGRVVSPSLPLDMGAGESIQVTVEITPSDTGTFSSVLRAPAEGPCPDTLSVPLVFNAMRGAVLADRLNLDLGTVTACNGTALQDSVVLSNVGNLPIDVLGFDLSPGSPFVIASPPTLPAGIPAGSALVVRLGLGAGATGTLTDTLLVRLDQPEQPLLRIPVTATVERAALAVTDVAGASVTALTFDTLTSCATTGERLIHLRNTGTVPDTVLISTDEPAFSVTGPAQIVLAPGADTVITVRAALNEPGTISGTLQLAWMPCSTTERIGLDVTYLDISASVNDLAFGSLPAGTPVDDIAYLENKSDADLVIGSVKLDNPAAGFEVIGSYNGMPLPAGGRIPVTIRFTPSDGVAPPVRLVAVITSPCPDTLYAMVSGAGTRDRIDTVHVGLTETRGRWGSIVSVPVAFRNERGAGVSGMELVITASAGLLDPAGARFSEPTVPTGWAVHQTGYDPSTGRLTLRVTGEAGALALPSSDSLLMVDFRVLRGSAIASNLELRLNNLPTNVVGFSRNGNFALEDYCDAYGRLLNITGNIALDQNVPNPFNPETIIEFETAFKGPVTLAVYDGLGHEVVRLVDEELPAGRRRVRFDARHLPSGVYTYKLITGLQVLTRRMVVTK